MAGCSARNAGSHPEPQGPAKVSDGDVRGAGAHGSSSRRLRPQQARSATPTPPTGEGIMFTNTEYQELLREARQEMDEWDKEKSRSRKNTKEKYRNLRLAKQDLLEMQRA